MTPYTSPEASWIERGTFGAVEVPEQRLGPRPMGSSRSILITFTHFRHKSSKTLERYLE